MGSMKGINGMDLTEAEDIKKRWQEYMSPVVPVMFFIAQESVFLVQVVTFLHL